MYKLSDIKKQREQEESGAEHDGPAGIRWTKVSVVFILFGILGLLTSWFYGVDSSNVIDQSLRLSKDTPSILGPFHAEKASAYHITVRAVTDPQVPSFIEGNLLDSSKISLFSFGEPLISSDDGQASGYEISITIPEAGDYFLQFRVPTPPEPASVQVTMTQEIGSSVPHLWFGVITLIVGLATCWFGLQPQNRTSRAFDEAPEAKRAADTTTDKDGDKKPEGSKLVGWIVLIVIAFALDYLFDIF